VGLATIRHVAKTIDGAFDVGYVDATLVPFLRAAERIDLTHAVLTDLDVATEPEVGNAAISGSLAHAVDGALFKSLVGAALIPRLVAAQGVELANAILTPRVVAADAVVAGAAIAGHVTRAISGALGARDADAALIPTVFAAELVDVADAFFTA